MLEYFFSKLFRGVKYTVGAVGAVAMGVVIIFSALGIQTIVIPICGGIGLIPVAFIFFENTKIVADMEKLVTQFKNETKELKLTNLELKETNIELKQTNIDLKETADSISMTKDKLVEENQKLEGLLDNAEDNINKLQLLTEDYQRTSINLGDNLKDTKSNLADLQKQAEELIKIKNEYTQQNILLKNNYDQALEQLELITVAKNNYETQLNQLTVNNNELSETSELLKSELNKTQSAYEDAKAALKTLLQATGVLQDLGKDMIETEKKTEENVGMMSKLMNIFGLTRSEELFNKLDTNKDGVLSSEEFVKIILAQKHT